MDDGVTYEGVENMLYFCSKWWWDFKMFLRTAHGEEGGGVLRILEYKQIRTNC